MVRSITLLSDDATDNTIFKFLLVCSEIAGMTSFREEILFQMFSAAGDPSGFGLFKMVVIPDMGEIPAPAPALLSEGPDHRMVFREGPGFQGLPDGPLGGDPAVRINRRVFPRVDVHRPAQGVPGEPVRPRDEPVIEGGAVVRGHRRLVGPAETNDRRHAGDGEPPLLHQGEDFQKIRGEVPVDDELAFVPAAVETAIPDVDQAEAIQNLPRRRRPGHGLREVHRAVHDHTVIRHRSAPLRTGASSSAGATLTRFPERINRNYFAHRRHTL